MIWRIVMKFLLLFLSYVFIPNIAFANVNSGDTAWIMTSTALVLFMTLPGLALFYTGLVQSKNAVSVLMHHFAIACLASILWVIFGYSLAFSEGSQWVGGLSNIFLTNLSYDGLSGSIPESTFIDDAMLKQAEIARKQGSYKDAIALYGRLIKLNASNLRDEAQFGIAECYEKMAEEASGSRSQSLFEKAFENYQELPFNFENNGAKIIHISNEYC